MMYSKACRKICVLGLLFLLFGSTQIGAREERSAQSDASPTDELLQALDWRLIGPYRGGRSAAVTGVVGDRDTYYFGATGGGVWKSVDAGRSWNNVSDGFFGGSIGAVAVSEWDPNVIYVGGGEKTVRGNVSHGNGVWKSVDSGTTWTHMGLPESRHIPRIRIHPKNPDLVYAAVLGHLFGSHEERGIYRSKDGGESWEKILFANADAGAVDLVLDPTNPRILYASLWRVRRTPYSLESGGEGSGLWKSTDGGDTWQELTRNEGLPEGTVGIIGISVSASNPQNLYAIVEAEQGGVFRSRDGGKTWTRTSEDRSLRQRAWYYSRIYADPSDEDRVYVLNVRFHLSKDGGKSFERIDTPHGDNHDLWIDPADSLRMIEANDGGANVSHDGGGSWTPQNNQPTAQFYRVAVDRHFPYRIYGGQQDNSTVRIAHRSMGRGISIRDWESSAGGESAWLAPDPKDPEIVYGGSYDGYMTRLDHRTRDSRRVDVWPDNPMGWGAAELEARFNWNFPILFSSHDTSALYAAGNRLYRSTDEGRTWEAISPDLTRDDKSKMQSSGGPITKDNTSVEYYGTIFTLAESRHEPGAIWTGSDDGLIQLTRDGGSTWTDVTPAALPEWTQINSVEADPFEAGGLYVAGTRYKSDDFQPYLYRTKDWGKTWTRIDRGIPRDHFTRVIRADPDRPGLLYAGTESGVYVSLDDGGSWRDLQLDLPIVPITDLAVHEGDLVAATQGRSFWVLDDLSLLHRLMDEEAEASFALLEPRPTERFLSRARDEAPENQGENLRSGIRFYYLLDAASEGEEAEEVTLEILDDQDGLVRRFSSSKKDDGDGEGDDSEQAEELLPVGKGSHRFLWDLRYEKAETFPGMILWSDGGLEGPVAVPGTYRARLAQGDRVSVAPFEILPDPRLQIESGDLEAQFEAHLQIRDKLTEVHLAIQEMRELRSELDALEERLEKEGDLAQQVEDLDDAMTEVEEALYQTKNRSAQDPLNFPVRLNDKLSAVGGAIASSQTRPTASQLEVKDRLIEAIDEELALWRAIRAERVPELEAKLQEAATPILKRREP